MQNIGKTSYLYDRVRYQTVKICVPLQTVNASVHNRCHVIKFASIETTVIYFHFHLTIIQNPFQINALDEGFMSFKTRLHNGTSIAL